MIRIAALIAAASVVAVSIGAPAAAKRMAPEAKLAKLLEGRVAGEPTDCIYLPRIRSARIIDRTAIVYDAGSVIYVNRPRGAETLDDDDIMVTRPHGSQLCSIDTVQLQDRSSFFYSGFVGLSEFVPYRKVNSRN